MTSFALETHASPHAGRRTFRSPHGILYALPVSLLLWAGILAALGVIR